MLVEDLEWKFSQVFGDNPARTVEVTEVDIVSAIEFDHSGSFIAAGDRGGRIVIFKQQDNRKYKFYAEFQAHEPEFDYLKSIEIEEKINKIKWVKSPTSDLSLLTTNDKTIKYWKVFNKKIKNFVPSNYIGSNLTIPQVKHKDNVVSASLRRTFSNAHAYHINSISVNTDGETYISSDDLRINLWNLEISDQSFNIVDIKPANMEELTEVITSAEFHPQHCHHLMYSSSKGVIKLADLRAAALCDSHSKVFEEEEDPASRSFFSEIISSISDIKFSLDGRYIISRDYLTVKIWDINMESKPVRTIRIHDHLRSKLCDLYENDCIFDKFECIISPNSDFIVTGTYNNGFNLYETAGKGKLCLEASKAGIARTKPQARGSGIRTSRFDDHMINPDTLDYSKKCLHLGWHPRDNLLAVGANNNMYIFVGDKKPLQ